MTIDSERGFRFRDRRKALTEIIDWMDGNATGRKATVVTGSPGAGSRLCWHES